MYYTLFVCVPNSAILAFPTTRAKAPAWERDGMLFHSALSRRHSAECLSQLIYYCLP